MNRLSLIILSLIFIFISSCLKNEIPGLVAAYYFSGNAFDEISNNHGVVHGARLTSDRFGNENSAYYFDGSTAYIEATVSNMPAVENPQTISWWFMIDQVPVYNDSLGADNSISLVDSSLGIGVQFGYRAAAYHTLGFDTWYWGGRTLLETKPPAVNEWHHCVYTYDGKTHIFYLDGIQTATSTVKPQTGTPNMLMLGNYPGGDQYFAGSLDDLRIYNRVLPLDEIKGLNNIKR